MTGKLIDKVVRRALFGSLTEEGLDPGLRNSYRRADSRVDVVNIQPHSRNYPGRVQFTVNLGVLFPRVGPEASDPDRPAEFECTVRTRLKAANEHDRAAWWRLETEGLRRDR